MRQKMDKDWKRIIEFFPENWAELAAKHGALKGLRKDKSPENMLRTMLLHIACGYSLRETAVRAKRAHLAELSAVALMKRLKKSEHWLYALSAALFREKKTIAPPSKQFTVRLFDGTNVKEPGPTGGLWRIHYSMSLPSLKCDFFKVTPTQGKNTGESFKQYPIQKGDYIIADRGYCHFDGIDYISSHGAFATVRLNSTSLKFIDTDNKEFPAIDFLKNLNRSTFVNSKRLFIQNPANKSVIQGRLCVVRKSEEDIELAVKKLWRKASKKGHKLKPETLVFAEYISLFSTFPEEQFSDKEILEWYRIRWQIELVFKRFKSLAMLGHLPKHNDGSARAWLYGKLFIALLAEKLIEEAKFISPCNRAQSIEIFEKSVA
jgi:hypothetical protein